VDRYESYGEKPKCGKIVISLLANVIVVECRHTRTLHTSARLDLSERTRTNHKVARYQQITSSGGPGSAARISVTMPAILGDILVVLPIIFRQVMA
jgi:hypothetical protein